MRVRGLWFRGLEALGGERRLDLSSAFACVDTGKPTEARALAWLLRALLQPDRHLASLSAWSPAARGGEPRARASAGARLIAWFVCGGESYRLAVDAPQQRAQLGLWDAVRSRYQPHATSPDEIAAFFAERSGSDRADFLRLRTLGVTAPESWTRDEAAPAGGDGMRVEAELERLRAEREVHVALRERREALRARAQRLGQRERELAALRRELEEQAALAALADDLEPRIAAFRAALELRDADRREIDGVRRKLLAERVALRGGRGGRRVPLATGLAAIALGALLAWLGELRGALIAPLGLALAAMAQLQSRGARRRLGRIDAVLAAQQVRERTAEQRFESETEPLRAALAALELPGLDALRDALAAYRELEKRVRELEGALRAERAAQTDIRLELERIETRLAEGDPAAAIARLETLAARVQARAASLPAIAAPPAISHPEELVSAATRSTGLDAGELRARVAAAIPLYLRALTRGRLTHARHHAVEGWRLRGPEHSGIAFAELPADLALQVGLAFQLALAERTAAERELPFLIGPDAPPLGSDQTRALRRLAGSVQVIRVGPPDPAWTEHAESRVNF